MGFISDLKFGNQYEQELIKIYEMDNYEIMKGKFKEYDIKQILEDGKIRYWECKADRFTHRTNNICIEFESYGKPSGIITTTANYYAYFVISSDLLSYDLYTIPTKKLRHCIENNLYKKIMNGGTSYKNKFYLFDKDLFEKYLVLKNKVI